MIKDYNEGESSLKGRRMGNKANKNLFAHAKLKTEENTFTSN